MRTFFGFAGLAGVVMAGFLGIAAAAGPAPTGAWRLPNGATVEIASCASALCGAVVTPPANGRLSTGQAVLRNLVVRGDLWKGEAWAPQLNAWTPVEVRRSGNTLSLKVCVSIQCRTQVWRPVS